ncbi:peptidylprolyl isomerase [Planctomycetota bacterium]|nr:peptidylprolyl isomerase [Planctomycetota bacterium]
MSDYKQVKFETSEGDFIVELWDDVAPGHAENMIKLVSEGFYDGITFHRVIPGFVIQGGCPRGDGTGGPGWNIKAEFNDREHQPGVLSMARSADPDSAGSQFFVCLTREYCQHLDKQYTAFGKVVEGFENVEKIAATPLSNPQAGTPENAPKINKATCL